MRCEQIQPILLEYSLQPSSCPDHEAIKTHLDGCESCRTLLEQERKLASNLSGLGMVAPASDMWSVIHDRIRVKTPFWQRVAPWDVWPQARRAMAAGMAVLVIGVATFVGVTQHTAQDRQNDAVAHLVDMQTANQVSAWSDDPLKDRSDRAQSLLGEGS